MRIRALGAALALFALLPSGASSAPAAGASTVPVRVESGGLGEAGVPGNEDTTDQDFVLVVSNGRMAA